MGCTDSVESQKPKNLSPYKLNKGLMPLDIQLKYLRNTFQVKKMKIEGNLSRNVLDLQKMFKLPLRSRNKVIEYQKIQESTWLKNQTHIYGVIINYLKVLEQYKHFLKDPQQSEELKPPLMNILYAKSAIQSDELQQFCGQILKKYPSLNGSKDEQEKFLIPDQIIKHHVNDRFPTKEMINKFAMEICNEAEDGITLSVINGSGNNFHYG